MARAQAQFLRIFEGATTYQRYQNFYVNSTVSWEGEQWNWLGFDCDGLVEGAGEDEGGLSITLPATPEVIEEVEAALRATRLAEVRTYEFDILRNAGAIVPPSVQTLVASYMGEVVAAGGGFETIDLELGSSLSPVGAQVPPRLFTSWTIGVPCKLFG